MDTETAEVVERINARMDALEASLRSEIRGESVSIREDLRAEIRGESVSIRDDLRAEFRERLAENQRHTDVQFDSVRDDIRILAEGFAVISMKLDALQR